MKIVHTGARWTKRAAMAACAVIAFTTAPALAKQDEDNGAKRFLIEFDARNAAALKATIELNGGVVALDYSSLFDGLAADLTPEAAKAVRSSGLAKQMEEDDVRTLHALPSDFPDGNFAEFVPWGRDRVNADVVWSVAPNFGTADNGVAAPNVLAGAVTGEGVVVGVLDSGIDYNHPDLAANIINDCGSGVIRDFLPSNYQGAGNAGMDDCPEDDTGNGHGTSGASVIASVDNEVGLIGVAPGAKIRPYRVCDGTCPLSAIIGGIMQATEDGVDVINMSFGGGAGKNFEASALQAAARRGVVLVASAGNDGDQKIQFPAGYGQVLAVGATDINDNAANFTNFGGWVDITGPGVANPAATCTGCGSHAEIDQLTPTVRSIAANPATGSASGEVTAELVDADPVNLACAPIATDLTGKIALVSRGACSFAIKAQNTEAAGAVGTVIYNNIAGGLNPTLGAFSAAHPVAAVTQAIGQSLVADIASAPTTIRLLVDTATDYELVSGTSFSGPHVAGVAALVRSANPSLSELEVRRILVETAESFGNQNLFGAGMVRADRAVDAAQQ